ncbi:riboflavin biosynthesis protein RibF [bacterium]|nr:riboflavin biosynthesis protein RibF [bacterium]
MSITLTSYGPKTKAKSLGLGVFDGIHKGHQAILSQCDSLLTFNPHPVTILNKAITLERLTTIEEMTHYIPKLFVLEFNQSIATLSAHDFLNKIILEKINPDTIVIGYDYHFGKNKEGTPEIFKQWCNNHNIPISIVEPISNNTQIIKSKAIRTQLKEGNINQALDDLGHPYLMIGTVVKGDNRGKELGFPTANLMFPTEKLIPQHGVYKASITIENKHYKTMLYIGKRPTFNATTPTVEAFILDFKGNLYDQSICLYIEHYLRPEKKFPNKESLIKQIHQDIHDAYGH